MEHKKKITSYNDLEVYQRSYKACLRVSSSKRIIIILNEHCALRHSVYARLAYGSVVQSLSRLAEASIVL